MREPIAGNVQVSFFLVVLVGLAVYYGPITGLFYVPLGWHLLGIVPSILLVLLLIVALGSITSILYNMRQDTILISEICAEWFDVTYLLPITYPPEVIPEAHRWLLYVNPLTPLIEFSGILSSDTGCWILPPLL